MSKRMKIICATTDCLIAIGSRWADKGIIDLILESMEQALIVQYENDLEILA